MLLLTFLPFKDATLLGCQIETCCGIPHLMRSHYLAIYWKKGLVLEQSIWTIHLHNLASTSIGCPRAESLSLALIFFSLLLPTYSHIFMHMCTRPRPNSAPAFIRETLPFGKKVLLVHCIFITYSYS